MAAELQINSVTGAAIADWIPGLAELRIRVFREFPYLYDGDLGYEERYLESYVQAAGAIVILAFDEDRLGGRVDWAPDGGGGDRIPATPHRCWDRSARDILLWRIGVASRSPGRGVYRHFFSGREAHARTIAGIRRSAFCAVRREEDHPLRPPGYESLEQVWKRFGYVLQPGLEGEFSWKDVGQTEETKKCMQFYLKELDGEG